MSHAPCCSPEAPRRPGGSSFWRKGGWLLPALFAIMLVGAATLSWRVSGNGLSTRLLVAVALMSDVALFTLQLSGHPWQADMHMYFFATLTTSRRFASVSRRRASSPRSMISW